MTDSFDNYFKSSIEYSGPASAQYQQWFLQPLITYCKDKQPEVRQAAFYGCGVLAMFGGDQFAQTCAMLVPILVEQIMTQNAREPENLTVTENGKLES